MSLFEELKHRNVFRVAVAYAIGSWLIAQIADLVLDNTNAPAWIMQVLFLMLAIGFVVALIISWAYEITPDGIKRDEALAMLPMLLEKPNGFDKWSLYLDPRGDFMRDDERFNTLIRPDNFAQSIHAKKKKRRGLVQ